jgi:hypothetical protein|tara:strand:+ start:399 stop:686 length:288 start_codon:yes stop_codon:yes gene_type:complete
MMNPIFAFVFPFGEERGEFRCKRNFVDEEAACEWAASMLNQGEVCYLAECESADYVFEPACESHTAVSWSADGQTWQMLEVIDDFDEAMEIYPIG